MYLLRNVHRGIIDDLTLFKKRTPDNRVRRQQSRLRLSHASAFARAALEPTRRPHLRRRFTRLVLPSPRDYDSRICRCCARCAALGRADHVMQCGVPLSSGIFGSVIHYDDFEISERLGKRRVKRTF